MAILNSTPHTVVFGVSLQVWWISHNLCHTLTIIWLKLVCYWGLAGGFIMFCILIRYKMTQPNNIFRLFKMDGEIYINLHRNVISTDCLQRLTKLPKMNSKTTPLFSHQRSGSRSEQCHQCKVAVLEHFGFTFDGWSGDVRQWSRCYQILWEHTLNL